MISNQHRITNIYYQHYTSPLSFFNVQISNVESLSQQQQKTSHSVSSTTTSTNGQYQYNTSGAPLISSAQQEYPPPPSNQTRFPTLPNQQRFPPPLAPPYQLSNFVRVSEYSRDRGSFHFTFVKKEYYGFPHK